MESQEWPGTVVLKFHLLPDCLAVTPQKGKNNKGCELSDRSEVRLEAPPFVRFSIPGEAATLLHTVNLPGAHLPTIFFFFWGGGGGGGYTLFVGLGNQK